MATIGLMEGAFFVGRKEIIDFINNTLELRLTKVEDTASGAVACQLLDIMYPNTVPMNKVDWSAKQSTEYLHNYKILQTCFTKLRIDRHVDVDRLITAKYMDNLEFMQWFKRYFELQVTDKGDYDCRSRRALGKGGAAVASLKASSSPGSSSAPVVKSTGVVAPATRTVASKSNLTGPGPKTTSPKPTSAPTKKSASVATLPSSAASNAQQDHVVPAAASKIAALAAQVAQLTSANEEIVRNGNELRAEMEGLEKERDFYFDKLRDIEIMLQDVEDNGKGMIIFLLPFSFLILSYRYSY